MLPDSAEIHQYSFSRSAPPPVESVEKPVYRMNVLERSWDRLGGLDWSKKVIILSALVSVLATAIAFGFFASLVFIPKYFTLSGDLARLAQVEKDMANLKVSQEEFQQQTLAQSLRLNEQLRDQGLKIESVSETAEAARQTVETKIETERRLQEEQAKAEQARQLALARQQAQPKTTTSSQNANPSPAGGPPSGASYSPPSPSSVSNPSPSVPSLINPEAGGSFFVDLAKAVSSFFGALFGQANDLDGQQ
ncbi:MAG: hypothetical protein Q8N84_04350 [bacterium]|nr:hypothetical protein [bacterium]